MRSSVFFQRLSSTSPMIEQEKGQQASCIFTGQKTLSGVNYMTLKSTSIADPFGQLILFNKSLPSYKYYFQRKEDIALENRSVCRET